MYTYQLGKTLTVVSQQRVSESDESKRVVFTCKAIAGQAGTVRVVCISKSGQCNGLRLVTDDQGVTRIGPTQNLNIPGAYQATIEAIPADATSVLMESYLRNLNLLPPALPS